MYCFQFGEFACEYWDFEVCIEKADCKHSSLHEGVKLIFSL